MHRPLRLPLLALAATLLAALLGGCAQRAPMTESEFLGFCHSASNRRGFCDSVGVCARYLNTVGKPQKDLPTCLEGCLDVRKQLVDDNRTGGCSGVIASGNDWCQRYCRTLYPE